MQAAKYGIREFSQMKVLVINAGSSSLKYQLLDTESGEVMAKGLCERIGIDGVLTHTGNKSDEKFKFDIAMPTHKEAIQSVINILLDPEKGVISSMSEIDAVGHRVVHGGEFFSDSVIITEKVLKAIEDCVPLAPLHNPPNLTGIQACREVMGPDVPMVAVFDTAFHQTMPQSHYMYAVPYEYYEKYKIRRYWLPRHQPYVRIRRGYQVRRTRSEERKGYRLPLRQRRKRICFHRRQVRRYQHGPDSS